MELGIYTFAEMSPDPKTGQLISPASALRDLIEEIELADQLGLDVFGVGEHHRPDFVVSAPAVVLAAAAARTKTDPPDQRGHRALLRRSGARLPGVRHARPASPAAGPRSWPGRGSFIESFPLFGYDLSDYDELFAEKLELLLAAARQRDGHLVGPASRRRSTISASIRARCRTRCPIWVAVGGTPESVGPRRHARPADGARHHRRRAGALRAVGRALPRGGRAAPATIPRSSRSASTRTATSPRHRRTRGGRGVPALRRDHEPHRPRARLAADHRAAVRRGARCAARTSSAARRR